MLRMAQLLLRLRAADARDAAAAGAAVAWCSWRHAATSSTGMGQWGQPDVSGKAAQPQLDLAAALAGSGLSHSAIMAIVGWHSSTTRASVDKVLERSSELQHIFGREVANRILVIEPALLDHTIERVHHNLRGLQDVLQLNAQQTRKLVRNHPTILRASPTMIRQRHIQLNELLQMEEGRMQTFLLRVPAVLRLAEGKLLAQIRWWQTVGGMTQEQIVKAFHGWPQLATTSTALLEDRYAQLQQLLDAPPETMRRICTVFPNLLARDTGALCQNAKSLQSLLGLPHDKVQELLRRDPGLLSFNPSTLATRWSYVMQVLRVPAELGVALLTIHRPLLSCHTELPERLETLKSLMRTTDDQLYPVVHDHLSLLRYPSSLMVAKVAMVEAVMSLHPPWAEAWHRRSPLNLVRIIMAGWGSLYRLAFLLATGQADTMTPIWALQATHAMFGRHYPDYAGWLDGYNAAVGAEWAVPMSGAVTPISNLSRKPKHPDGLVHTPGHARIIPTFSLQQLDSGVSATHQVRQQHGNDMGVPREKQQHSQDTWLEADAAGNSNAAVDKMKQQPEQQQQALVVEASSDAILAAWLGVPRALVRRLLSSHPKLAKLTWSAWGAHFEAAEALLVLLGHGGSEAAEARGNGTDPQLTSSSSSSIDGSSNSNPGGSRSRESSGSSSSSSDSECSSESSGDSSSDDESPLSMDAAFQRGAAPADRPRATLAPNPAVSERARAMLQSTAGPHPAAAAALCAASNLADFSPRLWQPLVGAVMPEVAAMLLACPEAWERSVFISRCRWLCALIAVSPELAGDLRSLTVQQLARAPLAPRCAYEVLQFLVAEQKPRPWLLPAHKLVIKGTKWLVTPAFRKAYPDFEEWRKGMRSSQDGGAPVLPDDS